MNVFSVMKEHWRVFLGADAPRRWRFEPETFLHGSPAVRRHASIQPNPHRPAYRKSVQRVINYIGRNLGEALDLPMLATIAGFSPYHFHRIFKSVTGERLFDCVRRMRLEWAATLLRTHRHLSVSDVAIESGFGALAPFARAFRLHFGMSASQWREGNFWHHTGDRWDWRAMGRGTELTSRDPALARAASGACPSGVTINGVTRLPGLRILYMRHVGPHDPERQATLWKRFIHWATTRAMTTPDSVWISVAQDNPHVVAPARCRYDVGLAVARDISVNEEIDVDVQELSGGDYLAVNFQGCFADEQIANEYLLEYWLPTNRLLQDITRPCITRFQGEPHRRPPSRRDTYYCQLLIPVAPRGRPLMSAAR